MDSKKTRLVGIAGGSCTGKTTLEKNLVSLFGDRLSILPFDDLFVGREGLENTIISDWESPALYRWDDAVRHLRDLKKRNGTVVSARSRESKKAGIASRFIEPRPIVLFSGFLALHDERIRKMLDLKIFLDLDDEQIISRRLARADSVKPWDSPEYIKSTLIHGHHRVVLPQREYADRVFDASIEPEPLAREVARAINETSD